MKNWARNYSKCVDCGTTYKKHVSKGLCSSCYAKRAYAKERTRAVVRPRGYATRLLIKEYLLREYAGKKRSLGDIASQLGCTRGYVHQKLKEFNIPRRSQYHARIIALEENKIEGHQRVMVNQEFFKTWSPSMAYVLGLAATDGCLFPKGYKFSITQKEPEILEKVKRMMDSDAKLYHNRQREYDKVISGEVWTLCFRNKTIYNDLLHLGITPRKSNTLVFPQVPEFCLKHFIRGCWDGDGGIWYELNNDQYFASFTSGSYSFISSLLNVLMDNGMNRKKIRETSSGGCYEFRYSGSQCAKLYELLYHNVPNNMCIERKKQLFKDAYLYYKIVETRKQEGKTRKQEEVESEKKYWREASLHSHQKKSGST